jgi:cytochrome c-type biogenesis protein CcsB
MKMPSSVAIILSVSALFYLSGAVMYFLYLFFQKDSSQKTAFYLTCAGFALHFTGVGLTAYKINAIPVENLYQTLLIADLALAGIFIIFQSKLNLKILGVLITPVIVIMMAAAFIAPDTIVSKEPVLKGFWLVAHIIMIFMGEAALAMACGTGVLYLIQERAIKKKKRGFFYNRLPSLDMLDSTGYSCITSGFVMLTFGLITGFIYAKTIWGKFWSGDPKEIWSIVTWLVYAALLHGRLTSGWRGKRSAIMAIVGFSILIFTFFGVNFFLGGYHLVFTK